MDLNSIICIPISSFAYYLGDGDYIDPAAMFVYI
jgi:hypothetical protein